MPSGELVGVLAGDLVGTVRGKAVPAAAYPRAVEAGVGWIPANMALDPFDLIAANPWGPRGELRMRPDPDTEVHVGRHQLSPMRFALSDLLDLDGSPWPACPRGLLRSVLARLRDRYGLRVVAAFEHEFELRDQERPKVPGAFTYQAICRASEFASEVVRALDEGGAEPEALISEYGPDQFEIPCAPAEGVAAADRALILREITREVARQAGLRASFVPVRSPSQVGNGVHIHVSLVDEAGGDAMGGDHTTSGLSAEGQAFIAGLLRDAAAVCAFAAPSPISYIRLAPGRWAAGYGLAARGNREALVRVIGDARLGQEIHLEYRAADATASPYLALAAIVAAGMRGLDDRLEDLAWFDGDPDELSDDERLRLGIRRLPATLEEALDAIEATDGASDWVPSELLDAYLRLKRHQLEAASGQTPEVLCEQYADVY